MNINTFFDHLWQDYTSIAPWAAKIKALFEQQGEKVVNDHVAFRTFNLAPIRLEDLQPHLLELGYEPFEPYDFPEKKLKAWSYVHPVTAFPKIFLSELLVEELSQDSQQIIQHLVQQIPSSKVNSASVFWSGRLWQAVTWQTYQQLIKESSYAAWVAALGLRTNHFTVSVNHLKTLTSLETVIAFLEKNGFKISEAGGKIKGSPKLLLEQAATIADVMPIEFADKDYRAIPTCYYEFARRYPTAAGRLYQGFRAANADKIFEATDRQLPSAQQGLKDA